MDSKIVNMREQWVMANALAYAIHTIESLPPRWQEASDKEDMKVLLAECFPMFAGHVLKSSKAHLDGAKNETQKTIQRYHPQG
jgi:hypothetical protein